MTLFEDLQFYRTDIYYLAIQHIPLFEPFGPGGFCKATGSEDVARLRMIQAAQ